MNTNIKELLEKSDDELKFLLNEKREVLRVLKFKVSSANLKNVKELSAIKKDIARILTLINSERSAV
ncbi:MAG: 50S ribosomal protein L29 [bacterium]